ncbi:MAG: hypothetical protein M3065_10220 [Actinomycetota bacterium]|nr:hypothetical protein [Actinomycetota bacterium]
MTGRTNIHRPIAAGLALAAGGAGAAALAIPASAPAAPAAIIQLDHACYQTAQKAALRGKGFDPTAHWSARLDGSAFGRGKTNSGGDIAANFGVPSHLRKGSTGEDSYKLVVTEGKHSASAQFLVTRLNASFTPQSGNLATLKVRFRLLGWGRGGSLYLHYVSPSGASRLDRKLGALGGACGHLSTSPLKLFPFTPKRGRWTLQFDKTAAYKAGSVPRVAVPYKIS